VYPEGIVSDTMSEKFGSTYLEEPDLIYQVSLLSTEAVDSLFDRPCTHGRPSVIQLPFADPRVESRCKQENQIAKLTGEE